MVVLDSDHLSLLESLNSQEGERLRQRLRPLAAAERAVTVVSFEEQSRGWLAYLARARTTDQLVDGFGRLQRHLKNYCRHTVLDFDANAAHHYEQLRRARLRIGAKDLQIAAIVLGHQALLLSRNLRHFRLVPNLRVEDWTS